MIKGLFADGLFSPVLKGLFDTSILTRYFTTFDSVASTQIDLSSAITLTGDFEIELDFALSALTGDLCFTSDYDSGTDDFFRIDASNGGFDIRIGGNFYADDGKITPDNALHNIRVKRVGTTLTRTYDGVSLGTQTVTASEFVVKAIGARQTFPNYFDGVISDVKIWDGGDRDTGTLVLDMPIDGQYGTDTIVENNQTVLGSELMTGAWESVSANVTANNQSVTFSGVDTSYIYARKDTPLSTGTTYLINVKVENYTSGKYTVQAKGGITPVAIVEGKTDDFNYLYTENGDNTYIELNRSPGSITAMSLIVSIKEIPAANPLGTAVNFVDADSEFFTEQSDGDWLGEELVVNGGFDGVANGTDIATLTNWSTFGALTSSDIVDGKAVITSTGVNQGAKYQSLDTLLVGASYVLSQNIGINSVGFRWDGVANYPSNTGVGSFVNTYICDNSTLELLFRPNDNSSGTSSIDNVSVKRILELP